MPALHIESEEKIRYRILLGCGFTQMTASGRMLPIMMLAAYGYFVGLTISPTRL